MKNISIIIFIAVFSTVSCVKDDQIVNNPENISNLDVMHSLNVQDPLIWNSLTTQSISIDEIEGKNYLNKSETIQEYPKGGNYYFALFEDLYPSEGDYDFNDVVLRSKYGMEIKGSTISGYLDTKLMNRGGSLNITLGVMFYEVSGKRYTRIPYDKIVVQGERLSNKPYTIPLNELGTDWKIDFEFENISANVWICYYIKTNTEIMSSGFAPTSVASFEVPHPQYLSPYSLPWGLEIEASSFAIPNEKELFLRAYPLFEEWVNSNGIKNKNWFDSPDSRYTHN